MKFRFILFLAPLLLVASWIYMPTLQGGFIFDDEHSLSKLQYINNNLSFDRLQYYLGHSDTGPLKRPISLFSFLLDAQGWPADARSFKQTNLVIHLINGSMLFSLLLLILHKNHNRYLLSVFICGFWLCHPFLISTTAYVVQRMTMLSTGFILLTLLMYCYFRLNDKLKRLPYILYIGLALSVLSKENGVLLLLLLPLTERLICQNYWNKPYLPKGIKNSVTIFPVIVFIVIFIAQSLNVSSGYELREFGWCERLLTQFRMLVKYLYHWMVPYYFTEGVFTDGIQFSKSIFQPITTLFSVFIILGIVVMGWLNRKKNVLLSYSIGFYLISHLIESSIFPLELYFEHRNYLASLFLVIWAVNLSKYIKPRWLNILFVVAFFHVCLQSYLRSELWADNFELHRKTMEKYPESVRATMYTANFYEWEGNYNQALSLLKEANEKSAHLQYDFFQKIILCKKGELRYEHVESLSGKIEKFKIVKNDFKPMGLFIYALIENKCKLPDSVDLAEQLISQLDNNLRKDSEMGRSFIYFSKGRVSFERKRFKDASRYFLLALSIDKDYVTFFRSISIFLQNDQPEIAKLMLEQALEQYEFDYRYKLDLLKIRDELDYFLNIASEDIANKQ